jgi:hypothetical protein
MTYKKTSNGKKVKVDKNPDNDYNDGYNAGRRYPSKPAETRKTFHPLLAILLVLILLLIIATTSYHAGQQKSLIAKSFETECTHSPYDEDSDTHEVMLPDAGGK